MYANCPKCAVASARQGVCPSCGLIFAKYRKPAPAKRIVLPPAPRYLPTLAGNLLPLAGVLVFGWSAAPALFFLWLDTLLCNLRILGPALGALWSLTHIEVEGRREPATPAFRIAGTPLLCLMLGAPAVMVGTAVYELMEKHHSADPLAAVFAAPGVWLFIALELAVRGYPIVARTGEAAARDDLGALGGQLGTELVNLLNRSMLVMILAWMANPLGYWGLVAFLVLAAAFISYVELHENWLQHLEAKAKQWGEEYRARKLAEKQREQKGDA